MLINNCQRSLNAWIGCKLFTYDYWRSRSNIFCVMQLCDFFYCGCVYIDTSPDFCMCEVVMMPVL